MGDERCEMELKYVAVSKLQNFKHNDYKVRDLEILERLTNCIKKFGQIIPVVITGERIVSGSNILLAVQYAGLKKVLVAEVKQGISLQESAILSLSLNELNFQTDYIKIAFMLSEMKDLDKLLTYLPFTKDDLVKLKHIKEFDWQAFCRTGQDSQPGLFADEPTLLPQASKEKVKEAEKKKETKYDYSPIAEIPQPDDHEGMYVVSFAYDIYKADKWEKPTRRVGTYEDCNEYVKQNKPDPAQGTLL